MASNITTNTKNALVSAAKLVRNRIQSVLQTGKYEDDADELRQIAGVIALPLGGQSGVGNGIQNTRDALAHIKSDGRQIVDPILLQMGREASSTHVDGQRVRGTWAALFRDIQEDLAGGTPDYFDGRVVTFASDPAASSKGVFKRLTVDHADEPIEDGYHNQTKIVRITSKPSAWKATAEVVGRANTEGDALDYRGGRPKVLRGLQAINDANEPTGITNPSLTPDSSTDAAAVATIAGWTITETGSPTFAVETTNLWRSRTQVLEFTGDNTEAVELKQRIPSSMLQDPYKPVAVGVPIWLESGWQGTIDITIGSTTQQFTHSDLTAGSFVHLFLDFDKDLFPINFDTDGAEYKLKFTNTQNNTQSIWCAGFLPQKMKQHEGVWYAHYSHTSEPSVGDEVTYADTMTTAGIIQDVVAFLYQDQAQGWAHLPTSGTTTISDPAYAPEIGITYSGSDVPDGNTINLGATSTSEQTAALVITNTGNSALAVAVPVDNGSPTNCSLTTAGLSVPTAIEPGDSQTVTVGVTPTGAGAFNMNLRIDNNDASEGTYEIDIAGTAS